LQKAGGGQGRSLSYSILFISSCKKIESSRSMVVLYLGVISTRVVSILAGGSCLLLMSPSFSMRGVNVPKKHLLSRNDVNPYIVHHLSKLSSQLLSPTYVITAGIQYKKYFPHLFRGYFRWLSLNHNPLCYPLFSLANHPWSNSHS
jgi:hypothetical protein